MSDKTKIFLNAHRFICYSANLKFAFDAHFLVLIQFILNTILITVIVVIFIVIRSIIIFKNIFIIVASARGQIFMGVCRDQHSDHG